MFNMKKTLSLIVLTAGSLAAQTGGTSGAAPATTAAATGPMPTKVAVLDIRRVIAATNEGRRDYEVLIKKFEPKQKEVDGLRKEIEDLRQQLQSAQNLSDADRATRVRSLEQKEKNLARVAEDAQKDFGEEQQQIIGRIGNKLMEVVDRYARQNGFGMVMDANSENPGPVLWASEQVNISQQILDAYNQASGVPAPAANAPSANRPAAPKTGTTTAPKAAPKTTTPKQ